MDFGLAWGFQDKTQQFLVVEISFRGALEEIKKAILSVLSDIF